MIFNLLKIVLVLNAFIIPAYAQASPCQGVLISDQDIINGYNKLSDSPYSFRYSDEQKFYVVGVVEMLDGDTAKVSALLNILEPLVKMWYGSVNQNGTSNIQTTTDTETGNSQTTDVTNDQAGTNQATPTAEDNETSDTTQSDENNTQATTDAEASSSNTSDDGQATTDTQTNDVQTATTNTEASSSQASDRVADKEQRIKELVDEFHQVRVDRDREIEEIVNKCKNIIPFRDPDKSRRHLTEDQKNCVLSLVEKTESIKRAFELLEGLVSNNNIARWARENNVYTSRFGHLKKQREIAVQLVILLAGVGRTATSLDIEYHLVHEWYNQSQNSQTTTGSRESGDTQASDSVGDKEWRIKELVHQFHQVRVDRDLEINEKVNECKNIILSTYPSKPWGRYTEEQKNCLLSLVEKTESVKRAVDLLEELVVYNTLSGWVRESNIYTSQSGHLKKQREIAVQLVILLDDNKKEAAKLLGLTYAAVYGWYTKAQNDAQASSSTENNTSQTSNAKVAGEGSETSSNAQSDEIHDPHLANIEKLYEIAMALGIRDIYKNKWEVISFDLIHNIASDYKKGRHAEPDYTPFSSFSDEDKQALVDLVIESSPYNNYDTCKQSSWFKASRAVPSMSGAVTVRREVVNEFDEARYIVCILRIDAILKVAKGFDTDPFDLSNFIRTYDGKLKEEQQPLINNFLREISFLPHDWPDGLSTTLH